jgi:hypothetical protein
VLKVHVDFPAMLQLSTLPSDKSENGICNMLFKKTGNSQVNNLK